MIKKKTGIIIIPHVQLAQAFRLIAVLHASFWTADIFLLISPSIHHLNPVCLYAMQM